MTLLRELVNQAFLQYQRTPPPAEACTNSLHDHLACLWLSRHELTNGPYRQWVEWPVEGTDDLTRASLLAAASHAADLDDVIWDSGVHPGSIVWPAAMESDPAAEPARVMLAVTVAYEVMGGVSRWLGAAHRSVFHATASTGVVGAAVASSLARHPDPEVAGDAASHAISVSGGMAKTVTERSATLMYHRAHCVAAGMLAARLAINGLEPTYDALAAVDAISRPASSELPRPDVSDLVRTADRWAIERSWHRYYASNGYFQCLVEAAESLAPLPSAEDADVSLIVGAPVLAVDGARPGPWWDIRWVAARVLKDGVADCLTHPRQTDGATGRLMERINIAEDRERTGLGATVAVRLGDGDSRQATVEQPLGSFERPLSDAERIDKWNLWGNDGQETGAQALALVREWVRGDLSADTSTFQMRFRDTCLEV